MFRIEFPLDLRRLEWFQRHRNCGGTLQVHDCSIGPEEEPGMLDISASYNCLRCGEGEYIRDAVPLRDVLAVMEKVLRSTEQYTRHDPMIRAYLDPDEWLAEREHARAEEH